MLLQKATFRITIVGGLISLVMGCAITHQDDTLGGLMLFFAGALLAHAQRDIVEANDG